MALWLLSCSSSESTESQIEEEAVFVDQGISKYADQNPYNDVWFQAFWWDSFNDSKLEAYPSFYAFMEDQIVALSNAHIDGIWLPPSSEGEGMGYHPRKLFDFNSFHGSRTALESLLSNMKSRKMHGMADLVINHRVGTHTWNDFTEPAWSCDAICMDDEGYTNPDAFGLVPCGDLDEGEGWGGARDLNHKSEEVQLGIKTYLMQLKALGFDSWRYDFVKGFPAKYVGEYNASTPYYLSVGEYWDGNANALRSWVDQTSETLSENETPAAAAFDFALKYKLAEAVVQKKYSVLQANPSLAGIAGYGEKSITFLDNHDTGCINRNDCDNVFSKNTIELIQGYAYLLTHPGIPMVWGYHYFFSDSFGSLQKEINALIAIRKDFGIHANSNIVVVEAKDGASGYYVAQIDQNLMLKIGSGAYAPGSSWKEERKTPAYTIWSK